MVVTRLVHVADIEKNTVEVKVGIDEPVEQLKPQMLARVRFLSAPEQQGQTAQLRQRVFAPSGLLQGLGDGQATVLVVGSLEGNRGVAERRAIRLGGQRIDGWHEIETVCGSATCWWRLRRRIWSRGIACACSASRVSR